MPNWHTLAPAAQAAQYQAWLDEASEAQVGCETHFYRSGTRLRKDPNLVSPSNRDEFDNLRRQLVSNETTSSQFDTIISTFRQLFPRLHKWLEWWLRPVIASMIFPAKRKMNSTVASEVPHSSNPVETQHAHLHHCVGKDHDLKPGIEGLYLHVEKLRQRHQAILGM